MQLSVLSVLSSMMALGSAVTLSYDTGYDQAARPLTSLACSDGVNGLITKYGWHTQGQVPHFPHIGGAAAVAGWNSPSCGTCWNLQYNGKSINILAVDHAASGFNIGQRAMDELTGGKAVELGRIDVQASQVSIKNCGV
ncbi:hypothetical protein NLU13_5696 [Sarocladium strictum]|uniref:Uncharacterized protein n=1 Tax=Sarocladium strictum TaxID=5046 RepID=A0AA39GJ21_SARSR|nr:hypothetical protein NLU13_5696 [Sarocladium strictum]